MISSDVSARMDGCIRCMDFIRSSACPFLGTRRPEAAAPLLSLPQVPVASGKRPALTDVPCRSQDIARSWV
jgi:hypothetical protein